MAIYHDLQWLEGELLEDLDQEELPDEEDEEPEEESFRPVTRRRSRPVRHAVYADERTLTDADAVFVEKKKRKVKGLWKLKFLALLELVGILAVLWWWIKWLY